METFVRRVLLLSAVVILVCQIGLAQAGSIYYVSADKSEGTAAASDQKTATVSQPPCVENSICPQNCTTENGCCCCCCACRWWYVDYEIQRMFGYTARQFGSWPTGEQGLAAPYAPESKLDYSLNSTWTGIKVGVQSCQWDVHLEWLVPMAQHIDGGIYDYDWNIDTPRNNATRLDSLSHSATRWNDGQQLNLEADYKYSDCILGMPIEVWPLAGFRWERLDMTAYGTVQLVPPDGPFANQGDIGTENQQFYTGFIGFQLRRCIERECRPPINLMFQFDWGATGGYSVDEHLDYYYRYGYHRYKMDSTGGDTIHLALCADVPLNCHWDLGLKADYYRIRTTGTERLLVVQGDQILADGSNSNGVLVKSEQTDITVYLQYIF